MAGDIERLEQEISALLAVYGAGVNSASRVINPLLQIWSTAQEIDPTVALPIQVLLTALAHRALITGEELTSVLDEARSALEGLATPSAV